jgi:hypothetical protein
MNSSMFGQIRRLGKLLGAKFALKVLLSQVNGTMFIQITTAGECPVTEITLIGTLASVN